MAIGDEHSMTDIVDETGTLPCVVSTYLYVKDAVVDQGYAWEMDWQEERSLDRIGESEFLSEAAWTVLSSGFRESIVRKLFVPISSAFLHWQSATLIQSERAVCRRSALQVFNNQRKIDAILDIAELVADSGFETIRHRIQQEDIGFLQTLPYVGSITVFHLAKNLGLPVIKPDRHLQRIADATGFHSPQDLCEMISNYVGEPIQVVDVVLWRYATLFSDYATVFAAGVDPITYREDVR